MDNRALFRQEAIDSLKSKWLGQALLVGSYPVWIIILVTTVFIGSMLLAIIFCDYTRRINVYGEVTSLPRAVNIFAPAQGFISSSWQQVGARVKKGDRLYQIDVSRSSRSGNVSENIIQATQAQSKIIEDIIAKLEANKTTTLLHMKQQLTQHQEAYRQTKASVEIAKKGMEAMKLTMQNYAGFKQRGLINSDQMTNQRYLYYQQQSVFQNFNTQLTQQNLQITSLQGDLITRAAEYDNQISQRHYELSELQRKLAEMDATDAIYIRSPVDGKVESLSVTQGQMVNSGDSLAQVIPVESKGYFLILWLPNGTIPYVSVGDSVNVRFDAFPYEKFGQFAGRIQSISGVPVSPQELSTYSSAPQDLRRELAEPFYKVIIDISRDSRLGALTLTTGMKVQATVFMEKRPLWQWMLAPFFDIYNSVLGPVNE